MKKLTAKLILLGMVFGAQVASGFYDSNLGRWLNRDPIEENGGLNLYAFAANNPTGEVDPFGLACGAGKLGDLFIPDRFGLPGFGYSFKGPCEKHDDCYGTCGKSRSECDDQWYKDMLAVCDKAPRIQQAACKSNAKTYYNAVKKHGQSAYDKAQKNAKEKK